MLRLTAGIILQSGRLGRSPPVSSEFMSDPPHPSALQTVLVAEDNAMIGFDITDALEAAGYAILGPARSCSDAFSWLERSLPDVAILDAMLKDGPCTELARELQNRKVPFIIYSGRSHREFAVEFVNTKWLEKPCAHVHLLTALDQMLAHGRDCVPALPPSTLGAMR
jgi:DNA-binding response OmpR family regulator